MQIGILTFHSQLNYGGVLQCWALQKALSALGHTVVVIDRWLDGGNSQLERGFDQFGIRQWALFWGRVLLGVGNVGLLARVRRTRRFLRDRLTLTDGHFVDWKNVPGDVALTAELSKLDAVVVGSDQVWNPGISSSETYLLDGCPVQGKIAYAASFGVMALPDSKVDMYRRLIRGFKAVSCREKEGVKICNELGVPSVHVADPTLLLTQDDWYHLIGRRLAKKRKLVCYFLSQDVAAVYSELCQFARRNHCEVEIFTDSTPNCLVAPIPKSFAALKRWSAAIRCRYLSPVKFRTDAGPVEFVKAFAEAQWVVADSFHALMFSIIFNDTVHIVRPAEPGRIAMFARILEFQDRLHVRLVVGSVHEALQSFGNRSTTPLAAESIRSFRDESLAWLQKAITPR